LILSPPRDLLVEAARRWGTPIWVTDLDRCTANLAAYRAALPEALIAYAVKANADPSLLRHLVADGAGCEAVTYVELGLALRAGCPPDRIVMNGVGRTEEELREALAAGALVNAESLDDLDLLVEAASDSQVARIGLRINPAVDAATHPHLATGAATSKFGIAREDLSLALARLRGADLPLTCLGAHIGSDVADISAYGQLSNVLAEAAQQADGVGLRPEWIDIGGGVASAQAEVLAELAQGVAALADRNRLICEPGRSLVADAGWLIVRVVRVQTRAAAGLTYLVADAGMTDLIRPVMYGADHPVALIRDGEALETADRLDLAGPVCEAGDVLAHDLGRWLSADELVRAGRGALLAIGEAGAYGAAMSMTYNGRPRAAEAVIDAGELRLSRRRETLDDLVARDVPAEIAQIDE
jgi:diaminopimelate decarboxylase